MFFNFNITSLLPNSRKYKLAVIKLSIVQRLASLAYSGCNTSSFVRIAFFLTICEHKCTNFSYYNSRIISFYFILSGSLIIMKTGKTDYFTILL